MPAYHFVQSQQEAEGLSDRVLPQTRFSVSLYAEPDHAYLADHPRSRKMIRTFDRATYYNDGSHVLDVGNCEGSVIFVDRTRKGVNKLHLGELTVKRPHAECEESHGKEGPRVDLWMFDLEYAEEWYSELERWRNPQYRADLAESYSHLRWYCISHRLKQLKISPEGLELKLAELQKHIESLQAMKPWGDRGDKRNLVSRHAHIMEERYRQTVELACKAAGKKDQEMRRATRKEKMRPKIIVAPEIILKVGRIRNSLVHVLDYITPNIDLTQAARYWDEVDSWENL